MARAPPALLRIPYAVHEEPWASCAGVGHAVRAQLRVRAPRAVQTHTPVPVLPVVGQAAQRLVDPGVALVGDTELLLQLGHGVRLDDGLATCPDPFHDAFAETGVAVCHHSS